MQTMEYNGPEWYGTFISTYQLEKTAIIIDSQL